MRHLTLPGLCPADGPLSPLSPTPPSREDRGAILYADSITLACGGTSIGLIVRRPASVGLASAQLVQDHLRVAGPLIDSRDSVNHLRANGSTVHTRHCSPG